MRIKRKYYRRNSLSIKRKKFLLRSRRKEVEYSKRYTISYVFIYARLATLYYFTRTKRTKLLYEQLLLTCSILTKSANVSTSRVSYAIKPFLNASTRDPSSFFFFPIKYNIIDIRCKNTMIHLNIRRSRILSIYVQRKHSCGGLDIIIVKRRWKIYRDCSYSRNWNVRFWGIGREYKKRELKNTGSDATSFKTRRCVMPICNKKNKSGLRGIWSI